jgi:tetratricopeptide (TPR) repeat protein
MPAPLELLQSAVKALRQGDLATAERLAVKMLGKVPREFHALHLLGIVRAQQRNFAESDRLMASALAIRAEPEALKNHGAVLIELGRHDEAIQRLNHALLMRPDYAEAHFNLGNALRRAGRLEESVAAFAAALRLKPNYAEALQNQADSLRDLNRQDEAIAVLRRAIEISPRNAQLFNNLGIALRDIGKIEEARAMFERARMLDPALGAALYNLARSGKADSAKIIADMEAALPRAAGEPANERARLHFALAKAYDDAGRHDDAFAQLGVANGLTRALIDYDEAAEARMFEHIRQVFDAAVLRDSTAGEQSQLPIFIVGFPRSGTTLTEQIIASHPAVHGGGELPALRNVAANIVSQEGAPIEFPGDVAKLRGPDLRRLGVAYLAHFQRLAAGIFRVTDKNLGNVPLLGFIRMILPQARIIHVRRDPVDTCLSCFSLKFGGNAVPFSYELGELGRAYRRNSEMMTHWRRVLPPGVLLELQYEDLVDDIEGQARRLIDYCGLPWDERCLSFHESERAVRTASVTQVRQPIYRTSVQRWRRYERHLGRLIESLGPDAIDATGR